MFRVRATFHGTSSLRDTTRRTIQRAKSMSLTVFRVLVFGERVRVEGHFSLLKVNGHGASVQARASLHQGHRTKALFPLRVFHEERPPPTTYVRPTIGRTAGYVHPNHDDFKRSHQVSQFILFANRAGRRRASGWRVSRGHV